MMRKDVIWLLLVCVIFPPQFCRRIQNKADRRSSGESSFHTEKDNFLLQKRLHKLKEFSREATKRLAILNDYTNFYNTYLSEILRVRVPGTVGHREVKKFIVRTLAGYGWHVEQQNFTMNTPLGPKNFTNIIATLNPNANRVLALAAHYDSKILEPVNGKYFIAATDSAVPCAMLLDMGHLLANRAKNNPDALKDVSPQLLFLDGEEAFVEWTKNDSIYGSRALAEAWASKPHHNKKLGQQNLVELDALDAFVLFDLLGAKNPTIYDLNKFTPTERLYNSLVTIEQQLRKSNQLTGFNQNDPTGRGNYFVGLDGTQMRIEDDHVPFRDRGVPILHLIPVPFPDVWHKLEDDETAIDPTTVEDLLKIFRHFVCAYFGLG